MQPGKIELLAIQAEGALDAHGRLVGSRGVTLACANDGNALWVGSEVPAAIARELVALYDAAEPSSLLALAESGSAPPLVAGSQRLLDEALVLTSGPTCIISAEIKFAADVTIVCSGDPHVDTLRAANPGNWHSIEWDELLDGRLGPWAIAVLDGRAVSIAHTARPLTARSAECGVWTSPEGRGRGYASAVTVAWAELLRPTGRHLFYSTSFDNRSSLAVAKRLGLELVGWTWRFAPAVDDSARIHPLCSLRAGKLAP